jgi:hypothetical protein
MNLEATHLSIHVHCTVCPPILSLHITIRPLHNVSICVNWSLVLYQAFAPPSFIMQPTAFRYFSPVIPK